MIAHANNTHIVDNEPDIQEKVCIFIYDIFTRYYES